MKIKHADNQTNYGPGVDILLKGDELAAAIDLYLYSRYVFVHGPRTITYKGELLEKHACRIHVDPSGYVIRKGKQWKGRGTGKCGVGIVREE